MGTAANSDDIDVMGTGTVETDARLSGVESSTSSRAASGVMDRAGTG